MVKNYIPDFCDCQNNMLLYTGSFSKKGPHWSDEYYSVHCYFCSECGRPLLYYSGHHDTESKKLYDKYYRYTDLLYRDSSIVFDLTRYNPDITFVPLVNKISLIEQVKHKLLHGTFEEQSEALGILTNFKDGKSK